MAILALKVLDKDSNTICVSSGEDFVDLVCTHTYEEGDRIVLETDEKNIHVHLQVDDALGDAFVYITDNVSYYVPFGEKGSACPLRYFPEINIISMRKSQEKMKSQLTGTWH